MNDRSDFEEWHRGPQGQSALDEGPPDDVHYSVEDVWGERSEPVAYRRARHPEWLAPTLVIVMAMLAFALAWFVTRGNSDSPSVAQPSTPSSSASSAATSGSASSNASSSSATSSPSSATSSESSSSSSNSSSSSDVSPAAFPADSVATCGDGESVPTSSVRLAQGTNSTCAYVSDVVNKVNSHLAQDAAATSFTIQPYSEALHRVVPLDCSRANHLSYCTGGTNVRLWVSDVVS